MKSLILIPIVASLVLPLSGQTKDATKPPTDIDFLRKSALEIDRHIASFYRIKKLPVPEVTTTQLTCGGLSSWPLGASHSRGGLGFH